MMATIEPRLIHLLNDSQAPDLPPIQLLPLDQDQDAGESLSLPPLDPDPGGQRTDKPAPSTTQIPPLHAVGTVGADDPLAKQPTRTTDNAFANDHPSRLAKSVHPLQLLLGDSEANTSTLSLRMIVDDKSNSNPPDASEDPSTKKRHRALTTKDDFVQLPQPLKKQKSTQQVVPPIIAGLHEPPPNAAVFPPITSCSFDDADALNLGLPKEFGNTNDDRGPHGTAATASDGGDKNNGSGKVKRRAAKPRRKWSDEETNHLLLGVSRHGVGKWTSILEDPDFKFNDRTAGDLKDRFRTCCPVELRGSTSSSITTTPGGSKRQHVRSKDSNGYDRADTSEDNTYSSYTKTKYSFGLDNLLIEPDSASASATPTPRSSERDQPSSQTQSHSQSQTQSQPDSDSTSTPQHPRQQRKSRAHRKNIEDLMELGIHGPFKKSHRRERRTFTEQDDKEILEGLDLYGPAWTKIQRDRRYNLSTRQPTDLRDRVRNKYPEIYTRIEKGSFPVKGTAAADGAGIGGTAGGGVLEPMVSTTIERALGMNSAGELNRSSSREDMMGPGGKRIPSAAGPPAFYESSESLPGLADVFVGSDPSFGPGLGLGIGMGMGMGLGMGTGMGPSEMDISRLLLEDASGSGMGEHPLPHYPHQPQFQQQRHMRYNDGSGSGGGVYGPGR